MKYLLIEHTDNGDPARLTICDTPETREKLTREAISSEPSDSDQDIENLRERGITHFEGDPPLAWLTVSEIRGEGWGWRSGLRADFKPAVPAWFAACGGSAHSWSEDFGGENGNYQNKCIDCGTLFLGHKRRLVCKVCATEANQALRPLGRRVAMSDEIQATPRASEEPQSGSVQRVVRARELEPRASEGVGGRRFPVLRSRRFEIEPPASIPWELIAPHEEWAQKWHGQSLERLAQRGGLGPEEMWHVINHADWRGPLHAGCRVTQWEAAEWLWALQNGAQGSNYTRASPAEAGGGEREEITP